MISPKQASSPSVLARLPWLLAMEALLLVVFVYPLYLREDWLLSWVGQWEARAGESLVARLMLSEIEPLITFHFSPLILKGAVTAAVLVLFLGVLVAGRFLRAFAPGSLPDWNARREPAPVGAFGAWLVMLLWMAISAAWSPTRELSRAAIPWLVVFGLFGFALLRRGIRTDEARQLTVLFMLLGSVVALISLLQATRLFDGVIFRILYRFDDPRNAYGSLMGHNTAVGSFMLMTFFPAFTLALQGGRIQRGLATAYVGLALVTMVIVQSRAVWLIGPPLIALYILKGSGWSSRTLRRAGAVLLPLIGLALLSQALPFAWNPLYLRDRPVARRLKDLSLEQLQKEARLRLLICSLPLVAESPVIGHGLYAFQFVYPKVQGDYFAAHHDTKLGFTNKRSHMAHNEYLQVVVEQGFVGLLLLGVALAEVFRRGWGGRRRLAREDLPLHTAWAFAAVGLALGAAVDFPFHIPQLVLPWMFCLAAFGSIVPLTDAVGTEGPSPPPPVPQSAGLGAALPRLRLDRVFGLALAIIVLALSPVASYFFVQSLAADTKFLHASSFLNAVRDRAEGMHRDRALSALEGIIRQLRHVALTQPFHGHARFLLGEAHYTLARTLAEGAPPGAGLSQVQAIQVARSYETAIEYIRESMKTLRTHHSYYVLALCYRGLAGLAPPDRREQLMAEYEAQLESSVHFAPGYEPALYLLAEWLAARPDSDRARVARYRRAIRTHAPHVFRDRYLAEAVELVDRHRWDEAVRATEAMLDVDPSDPRFLNLALYSHLHRGLPVDLERTVELCDRVSAAAAAVEPPGPEEELLIVRVRLYRALAMRNWEEALRWLAPFEGGYLAKLAWLHAIERLAEARLGLPPLEPRIIPPESVETEDWERNLAEMELLAALRLFDDPGAARAAFDRRVELDGTPGPAFWAEAAALADRVGDEVLGRMAVEKLGGQPPPRPANDPPAHSVGSGDGPGT